MNYDRGVRFVGPADLVCGLMWVRDWGCGRGSWQCVVGVRGICGVEAGFKGWVDDQLMVETVRSHRGYKSVAHYSLVGGLRRGLEGGCMCNGEWRW